MPGFSDIIRKVFVGMHRSIYRSTGGRLAGKFRGALIMLLTTRGRKTGKDRTWPLLYTTTGDNYVVIASNNGSDRHPAWFLNLEADPEATVQIDTKLLKVKARTTEGEERAALWQQMVDQYDNYESYQKKTERKIPVVVLEPTSGG